MFWFDSATWSAATLVALLITLAFWAAVIAGIVILVRRFGGGNGPRGSWGHGPWGNGPWGRGPASRPGPDRPSGPQSRPGQNPYGSPGPSDPSGPSAQGWRQTSSRPEDILAERFARGEIDEATYRRQLSVLRANRQ